MSRLTLCFKRINNYFSGPGINAHACGRPLRLAAVGLRGERRPFAAPIPRGGRARSHEAPCLTSGTRLATRLFLTRNYFSKISIQPHPGPLEISPADQIHPSRPRKVGPEPVP